MQIFTNQKNIQLSISDFIKDMENKYKSNIIVEESYQRKYVWNDIKMKRDLINSIILDRPLGNIILWKNENNVFEIVDGQQRIKTIREFIRGKEKKEGSKRKEEIFLDDFYIKSLKENSTIKEWLEDYAENDPKANRMLNEDIKKLRFKDFPDFLKSSFERYQLNITQLFNLKKEDIKDYFRVLQNQEKLKAGELIHSANEDVVSAVIESDSIKAFCLETNFNNDRMGFVKHFGVFLGFMLEKMKIGLDDKKIVDALEKINISELKNDENIKYVLEKIAEDLNKEDVEESDIDQKQLSVLGIKVLFLTYLKEFNFVDFQELTLREKSRIIKKVTTMVGYWNSNDEGKKDRLLRAIELRISADGLGNDYNKIKLGLKDIWKFSRTTHDKKNVISFLPNIKELLKFLLENQEFEYLLPESKISEKVHVDDFRHII